MSVYHTFNYIFVRFSNIKQSHFVRCGSGYRYYIEYGDCFEEGSTRSWMLNAFSLNAMVSNSRKLKERVLLKDMPSGRNFQEDIIKAMRNNHAIVISYYSYNTEKYFLAFLIFG